MASSKVVTTNPDLPRDSSISSLSTLLSDLHHNTMDDLFKSMYTPPPHSAAAVVVAGGSSSSSAAIPASKDISMAAKTVDEVWKEIVAGSESQSQRGAGGEGAGEALEEMTLEDFLTKAGAVREEDVRGVPSNTIVAAAGINGGGAQFAVPVERSSSVEAFGNGIDGTVVGVAAAAASASRAGKGKRRAVEEPVDKATLQKQRRMIKNRESAARSRERKQAYTVELEYLVQQLEEENARLLNEEADKKKQRFKQLMECLIPVVEKREPTQPRRKLRRVNSLQW